jgi:PAS domain S-box-containing protein
MIFNIIIITVLMILFLWIVQLKKKLHRQKEDFDYFLDNVPLFVDAFDENGKCVLWNKECERVFGWSIDEINAVENSLALFYPDEEDQKKTLDILQNLKDCQLHEYYPKTKEEEVIISQWASLPIPNGNSIAIGYDVTTQSVDIVKERTLQLNETKQKLAELNTSLEKRVQVEVDKNKEQQKMMMLQCRHAQMGETLSMIAHQWRQPLNNLSLVIQDAVFQYKSGKFNDETMQVLNEESFSQIQQMSRTITDFKNFFKPDKVLREIDVLDAISQALTIVQPTLESEAIVLESNLAKDVTIMGYASEFEQAIVNILLNAKDALVDNNIDNKSISILLESNEESVTLSIKDNAGGIPADIMDNIFDPYFSTKHQKQGTGLGLYISKIIIEDHMQGKLTTLNSKDGAVFTFTFDKEVNASLQS